VWYFIITNTFIPQRLSARQALSFRAKSRDPWNNLDVFDRIFRLRSPPRPPLKMTKNLPRDRYSRVARHDRSARSHLSEQRLCNRDPAQRFFPAKILCRADVQ